MSDANLVAPFRGAGRRGLYFPILASGPSLILISAAPLKVPATIRRTPQKILGRLLPEVSSELLAFSVPWCLVCLQGLGLRLLTHSAAPWSLRWPSFFAPLERAQHAQPLKHCLAVTSWTTGVLLAGLVVAASPAAPHQPILAWSLSYRALAVKTDVFQDFG